MDYVVNVHIFINKEIIAFKIQWGRRYPNIEPPQIQMILQKFPGKKNHFIYM